MQSLPAKSGTKQSSLIKWFDKISKVITRATGQARNIYCRCHRRNRLGRFRSNF